MDAFIYVLSVNGLIFFLSIIFYFIPPKKIKKRPRLRRLFALILQKIGRADLLTLYLFGLIIETASGISSGASNVCLFSKKKCFLVTVCCVETVKSIADLSEKEDNSSGFTIEIIVFASGIISSVDASIRASYF